MTINELKNMIFGYSRNLSPDALIPIAKYFPIIKYCLEIRDSKTKVDIKISKDNGSILFGNLNATSFYNILSGKDISFHVDLDNINDISSIIRLYDDNRLFYLNCAKNKWPVEIVIKIPTKISKESIMRLSEASTATLIFCISSSEENNLFENEIKNTYKEIPVKIIKRILYSPK